MLPGEAVRVSGEESMNREEAECTEMCECEGECRLDPDRKETRKKEKEMEFLCNILKELDIRSRKEE